MNRKLKIDCSQFIKIIKPEIAYFLGFLWADGCIYTKKKFSYLVQIAIISSDFIYLKPILDSIADWNYWVFQPSQKNWKERTTSAIYSKELVQYLMSNGYDNKENPHTILDKIPINLHKYFWRGLFDGDGNITCTDKSNSCGISSSFNQNWSLLKLLGNELCIKYFIQYRTKKTGKSSNFGIPNRTDMVKFLSYIYDGFEIDNIGFLRKYNNFLKIKNEEFLYRNKRTSTHKGICFVKERNKWKVNKMINGKFQIFYGFLTENDAYNFLKTL